MARGRCFRPHVNLSGSDSLRTRKTVPAGYEEIYSRCSDFKVLCSAGRVGRPLMLYQFDVFFSVYCGQHVFSGKIQDHTSRIHLHRLGS